MSSIIIPRKWQTQPQYPVEVNWGNSLLRKPLLVWASNLGRDAVSGTAIPIAGRRPDKTPFLAFYGKSETYNSGSISGFSTTELTVVSLVSNANGYGCYNNSGTPGERTFSCGTSGYNLQLIYSGANYSSRSGIIDHSLTAGRSSHLVAFTADVAGDVIRGWRDGIERTVTKSGTAQASATYATRTIGVAYAPDGNTPSSGLFIVLGSVLSPDEVIALSREPWQIFRKQPQVLYFDVGGGATIAPTPGSTVVAGFAPTISQPQTVAPGVGAEVYAGQVPSIAQAVSITPTDGAVSFAGSAPTISQPQVVTPGVGAEVYAGQVPSIAQAVSIIPTDGAVTFAGSVPVIGQSRTVVVGTVISRPDGTIDATGFTPVGAATIHECLNEVTPDDATYIVGTSDAVSVSLQDIADPGISTGHVVRFRAKADSGWVSVVLLQGAVEIASKYSYGTFPSTWTDDSFTLTTGQADSITDYTDLRLAFAGLIGNVYYSWVEFSVAQFPLVVPLGYAPSIAQAVSLTPTAGTVSFAGSAPTISQPQTVAPGVGAEVYAGQVPEISQAASVRPDVGAVSFAGSAPTISQPQTVTTVTGSVLLEGLAPAVTQGVTVSPGAGSEVVLGYVPTLTQGASVQPVDGAVSFAGFEPAISQPHTIITVTGAYAILGAAPTVTQAAIISPTDGAVDVDGYIPAIAQPRTITTVTGVATWLGFTPGIGSPVEFAKYLAGVRVYHTDADAVVKHTTSDVRVAHTTSSVRV